MKETWKQLKKGAVGVSCCMLALGILTILWPDISALTVCIILGIFCIAEGIYMIVRYFKLGLAGIFFRSDLFFGICSILLGTLLLIHPYGAWNYQYHVCVSAHTQSFSGSNSAYDLYWPIADNLEYSQFLFHSLYFKSN